MANQYVAALEKGARYYSYQDFQTALAIFCHQTNSRFTIHDCKAIETFNSQKLICDRLPLHLKYKYAKVACERFGQPRHEGRGIRRKESKKNGCGAHVTLAARKTESEAFLIVLRMVTKHSNQCEIRKKQTRMIRRKASRTSAKHQITVPNVSFEVKQEPVDNNDDDNSMQEYNYHVKPVVVYSDDENEIEEQKPIPIFHLTENLLSSVTENLLPAGTENLLPAGTENLLPAGKAEDTQATAGNEENASEDVKPQPGVDRPSLRALLLPAMALNFSQRVLHTET